MILDPKTLQLGNLLQYYDESLNDSKPLEVVGITKTLIGIKDGKGIRSYSVKSDKLMPIHLNDEILCKLGNFKEADKATCDFFNTKNSEFLSTDKWFTDNWYFYIRKDAHNGYIVYPYTNTPEARIRRVTYIHELQNLYLQISDQDLYVERLKTKQI